MPLSDQSDDLKQALHRHGSVGIRLKPTILEKTAPVAEPTQGQRPQDFLPEADAADQKRKLIEASAGRLQKAWEELKPYLDARGKSLLDAAEEGQQTEDQEWFELLMRDLTDEDIVLSKQTPPEYGAPKPLPEAVTAEPVQDSYFVPSFYVRDGIPYMPLPDAARLAGVNRETLLNWMKKKIEFEGEPIDGLYFKPTGNHYISKSSVERMANRFIKWPSEIPAGSVTIGKTTGEAGYLPTSEAAQIIGIPDQTLRLWVRLSKGPLDKPLDAVKCTTSGYFYIQHKDVLRLAEHVKDRGIARGRRAQPSPQP